jgi:hypothetical protein
MWMKATIKGVPQFVLRYFLAVSHQLTGKDQNGTQLRLVTTRIADAPSQAGWKFLWIRRQRSYLGPSPTVEHLV